MTRKDFIVFGLMMVGNLTYMASYLVGMFMKGDAP